LITGPPESGKSELAESFFARVSPKLYVATLPRTPEHMVRIRRHQRARSTKGWHTLEYSEQRPLSGQLGNVRTGGGLLVDGLVALLIRRTIAAPSAEVDADALIRRIASGVFCEVRRVASVTALTAVVFSDRARQGRQATARRVAMHSWMEQYLKMFPEVALFHGREGAEVICPIAQADRVLDLAGGPGRRNLEPVVVSPAPARVLASWYTGGPCQGAENSRLIERPDVVEHRRVGDCGCPPGQQEEGGER
jgi:adenosyl cobinamide kinase/adenosyl cobinamide phosphate guanylyltransferase